MAGMEFTIRDVPPTSRASSLEKRLYSDFDVIDPELRRAIVDRFNSMRRELDEELEKQNQQVVEIFSTLTKDPLTEWWRNPKKKYTLTSSSSRSQTGVRTLTGAAAVKDSIRKIKNKIRTWQKQKGEIIGTADFAAFASAQQGETFPENWDPFDSGTTDTGRQFPEVDEIAPQLLGYELLEEGRSKAWRESPFRARYQDLLQQSISSIVSEGPGSAGEEMDYLRYATDPGWANPSNMGAIPVPDVPTSLWRQIQQQRAVPPIVQRPTGITNRAAQSPVIEGSARTISKVPARGLINLASAVGGAGGRGSYGLARIASAAGGLIGGGGGGGRGGGGFGQGFGRGGLPANIPPIIPGRQGGGFGGRGIGGGGRPPGIGGGGGGGGLSNIRPQVPGGMGGGGMGGAAGAAGGALAIGELIRRGIESGLTLGEAYTQRPDSFISSSRGLAKIGGAHVTAATGGLGWGAAYTERAIGILAQIEENTRQNIAALPQTQMAEAVGNMRLLLEQFREGRTRDPILASLTEARTDLAIRLERMNTALLELSAPLLEFMTRTASNFARGTEILADMANNMARNGQAMGFGMTLLEIIAGKYSDDDDDLSSELIQQMQNWHNPNRLWITGKGVFGDQRLQLGQPRDMHPKPLN